MAKTETPKTPAEDSAAAPSEPAVQTELAVDPVVEPTPDPTPEPAPEDDTPSLAKPELLGFIKIIHPEGATSASHNGQTYEADANGVITVPNEAFAPLAAHGFVQA